MNIFILDTDPVKAAEYMCDKHIVKMVTESAQMLSTARRLLDGKLIVKKIKVNTGRTIGVRSKKHYKLADKVEESELYLAAHTGHPCTIWTMQSATNYQWLYRHYVEIARQYTLRYGKKHGAFDKDTRIGELLAKTPLNIPKNVGLTPFAIAMKKFPDCIVPNDPVTSYRNYYIREKSRFAAWKLGNIPAWYQSKA
jgi:hypothetical protein